MTETVKIEIYADNLGVTQAIATQLAQLVATGTIILLEGNLGSGKTTFLSILILFVVTVLERQAQTSFAPVSGGGKDT